MKIQTLKGFRDFLPKEARKRQYTINTLKQVFESYGFEPLETPALEYEEILLGKYGDEGDKLMYRFEDNGKRRVALRYDQTVPLARVVAQYGSASSPQALPMPFKRYQIQNVWRAENTQKGRFREFLQCDIDTVGSPSLFADAEIIAVAVKGYKALGLKNFKVKINDRSVFSNLIVDINLPEEKLQVVTRALDKIEKIGKEKVLNELSLNLGAKVAISILQKINLQKKTESFFNTVSYLKALGINEAYLEFDPTLARGLDYYTGLIFEIVSDEYKAGSLGGGGRYDNLIGTFAENQFPAVGFAFGFDRLMEAMEELNLFPKDLQTTKVLVTIFSEDLKQRSLDCSLLLRSSGVSTELYLDENSKMEKQLKYADKKGIPYVVIIGPDEVSKNMVTLRDMKTREQLTLTQKNLASQLV